MSETAEFVVVVTGSAQDELHLSMEACLEIASRGDRTTLVIPSYLFSAIPPSFTSNPLVAVAQIGSFSGPPKYFDDLFNLFFRWDLEDYLEERRTAGGGELPRKLYAVAESTREVFRDFNVPVEPLPFELWLRIAIQRLSKAPASDVRRGEARLLAGLAKDLAIGFSDIEKELYEFLQFGLPGEARLLAGPPGPGPRPGGGRGGPPKLDRPPWVLEAEGSILPLLPEQYFKTSGSVIYSREILSYPSTGGFPSSRRWNSTSPQRSLFAMVPFLGKRFYNTEPPGDGDHQKAGHVASNNMPKNAMDDESKGISEAVASEAFASFQFDLKFQCRIGRLQIGASISRLARNMR